MTRRPRIAIKYEPVGEHRRRVDKVFLVFPACAEDDVEHWFEVPFHALTRTQRAHELEVALLEVSWPVTEVEVER